MCLLVWPIPLLAGVAESREQCLLGVERRLRGGAFGELQGIVYLSVMIR